MVGELGGGGGGGGGGGDRNHRIVGYAGSRVSVRKSNRGGEAKENKRKRERDNGQVRLYAELAGVWGIQTEIDMSYLMWVGFGEVQEGCGGRNVQREGKAPWFWKSFILPARTASQTLPNAGTVCTGLPNYSVFAIGSGSGSGWRSPSGFTPDRPVLNPRTWSRTVVEVVSAVWFCRVSEIALDNVFRVLLLKTRGLLVYFLNYISK